MVSFWSTVSVRFLWMTVGFVAVDGLPAVVADPFVFVVFDFGELVLLGVQPELFCAFLVFEAQGVGVAVGPVHGSSG